MAWPLGETATVDTVPSGCQVWWQVRQALSLGHFSCRELALFYG